ncbi:amino acid/amide ABC transporter ATP-binding protein 1 (HAAT family) [Roseovarius halotolerans]|uniref:Lipopolysaccharide export system ATP-binding protein LptB n=1 Tax=Roseovarius halotolerans TaxID=505353 RepID=A0A1X6YZN1_9RHOB|nr:ABC transporter ATP-binding protein [Roseovarius halotolerans]RKT32559.1 amino acid/amide ABC transporter ATP-binding protein 1 (HAAT family) [Roseovarius halotolerans]SLN35636.1 Lipopolysaccharide export system ATP-binding protein LptB [Roseovarius halotolerans]
MTDPVLVTKGLTKSFGAVRASHDVSLDLRPGEIHAVIGPNGAGKSTLIAQICGGLKPDAGRVSFAGRDVTHLPTRARARLGLARTFQVSALAMEDTVLQNATLGALGAKGARAGLPGLLGDALAAGDLRDTAMSALERVGLAEHAATVTSALSHGQRRQLEVAVALTLRPRAFIMDEPMAGMGTEGSQRMTAFLDGLRDEAPILLVEHDMDAVFALADRLSVLVYGRIIATGSVDEIRANAEVRKAYLGEDA